MSDIQLRHGHRPLPRPLPPLRPGSDERKLVKALESAADAVVADLEDAVTPGEKAAARVLVGDVFAATPHGPGPLRLVRVNACGFTVTGAR